VGDLWSSVRNWFGGDVTDSAAVEEINRVVEVIEINTPSPTKSEKKEKQKQQQDAALRLRMPGLWSNGMVSTGYYTGSVDGHAGTPGKPSVGLGGVRSGIVREMKEEIRRESVAEVSVREVAEKGIVGGRLEEIERKKSGGRTKKKNNKTGVTKLPVTPKHIDVPLVQQNNEQSPDGFLFPKTPSKTTAPSTPMVPPTPMPTSCPIGTKVSMRTVDSLFRTENAIYWIEAEAEVFGAESPATALLCTCTDLLTVKETGAHAQGIINWSIRRGEIESLTLCAAATSAELRWKGGGKTVKFMKTEDCLEFAQAFYGGRTPGKKKVKRDNKLVEDLVNSTPGRRVGVAKIDLAVDCELVGLSGEERDLIEVYRKKKDEPATPAAPSTAPSTPSAAVLAKYRKMLKMSVPAPAVENKMRQEGVEEKYIGLLFSDKSTAPTATPAPPAPALSPEDEAALTKYRKMLKMNVPPPAVEHKMRNENVSPHVIELLFPDSKPPAVPAAPPTLTKQEEEQVTKYQKMLKLNVPPPAVEHKMRKEGVSDAVILAVLPKADGAAPTTAKKEPASKKSGRTSGTAGVALMNLHWTPLTEDAVKNSVWGKVSKAVGATVSTAEKHADVLGLEELFHKKTGKKNDTSAKAAEQPNKKAKKMAGLIDLTRANNVAIGLKAFKEFKFEEIVEIFNSLDGNGTLKSERITGLASVLPTDIELKAIKNFKGGDDELLPAEQFFLKLERGVKRVGAKMKVLETMDTTEVACDELVARMRMLSNVCAKAMSSEALQRMLETILAIGNIMNEGTTKGEAQGFTLDSLLKLTQTKSADGKMTVLDYIVTTFAGKGDLGLLEFSGDFEGSREASRMNIGEVMGEVRATKNGLALSKTEAKKMRIDMLGVEQTEVRVTRSSGKLSSIAGGGVAAMLAKRGGAPAGDPRTAMMAALKKKAPADEPADPRAAMMAALKLRSSPEEKKQEEVKEPVAAKEPVEDSAAIKKLDAFIGKAQVNVDELEKEGLRTVQSCKDLAKYFGETGEEKSASHILTILTNFVSNIKTSIAAHHMRVEREKKAAAKAAVVASTPSKPAAGKGAAAVGEVSVRENVAGKKREAKGAGGGDDDGDDSDEDRIPLPPFARLKAAPSSIQAMEDMKKSEKEARGEQDPRANLLKMIADKGKEVGEQRSVSVEETVALRKVPVAAPKSPAITKNSRGAVKSLLCSPRANDLLARASEEPAWKVAARLQSPGLEQPDWKY